MLLNCFRAKLHTVEFMAADASAIYLATGHGRDVRIWKGDGCRMPLPVLLYFFAHLLVHQMNGVDTGS